MDPILTLLVILGVAKIALLVGVLGLAYRVYRRHLVDGVAHALRRAVLTIVLVEGVGLILVLDGSLLLSGTSSSILPFLLLIPVAAAAIILTTLLFALIVIASSLLSSSHMQGSQ